MVYSCFLPSIENTAEWNENQSRSAVFFACGEANFNIPVQSGRSILICKRQNDKNISNMENK